MANREACELWIEQEINSGIDKGKNACSIGKEISDWVAKLFEVKIPPRTIEQRARRMDATNVAKKSNNSINTEVYYTPDSFSATKPTTKRGGKRKGAGRHKKSQNTIETYNDEFIIGFCDVMKSFEGLLIGVSKSLSHIESIAAKEGFYGGLKSLSRTIEKIGACYEQNESGKQVATTKNGTLAIK